MVVDGIYSLEQDWVGPLVGNTQVNATYKLFQELSKAMTPRDRWKWRYCVHASVRAKPSFLTVHVVDMHVLCVTSVVGQVATAHVQGPLRRFPAEACYNPARR